MSSNYTVALETGVDPEVFRLPWLAGIGLSCACLVTQCVVLGVVPASRRYDELVLLQLTAARLMNTVCEYCIVLDVLASTRLLKDAVFALCYQSDLALVCWMFLFSQHLHGKVVRVFTAPPAPLAVLAPVVWLLCLPAGLACPVLLSLDLYYFSVFYKTYAVVKFIVVTMNALIFIEIFSVVFRSELRHTRDIRDTVKTAAVAFCLVTITSLQVFLTDLLSLVCDTDERVAFAFSALNSFQAGPVTAIFLVLVRSKVRSSELKNSSLRSTETVV